MSDTKVKEVIQAKTDLKEESIVKVKVHNGIQALRLKNLLIMKI